MPYYLYKLSVKGCKKYYIGVTSNPEERKKNHSRKIESLVKFFKSNSGLPCDGLMKCHYDLGCALSDNLPDDFDNAKIKSMIVFKILAEKKYIEDILKLERESIRKSNKKAISNIVHA